MGQQVKVVYNVESSDVSIVSELEAKVTETLSTSDILSFSSKFGNYDIFVPVVKYVSPGRSKYQLQIIERRPFDIETESGTVYIPWTETFNLTGEGYSYNLVLLKSEQIYSPQDICYYGPWIERALEDYNGDLVQFIQDNYSFMGNFSLMLLEIFLLTNRKFFTEPDIPSAVNSVNKLTSGISIQQAHTSMVEYAAQNIPTLSEIFKDFL